LTNISEISLLIKQMNRVYFLDLNERTKDHTEHK
jgi:hypothetical protein